MLNLFFILIVEFQVFKEAVQLINTDKGFDLGTENAENARLMAQRLLLFMEANKQPAISFAKAVVKSVRLCCTCPNAVTCHTFKEKMWEKFYKLCSSDEFRSMWMDFLTKNIGLGHPIFYQFVTRAILDHEIRVQLPTSISNDQQQSGHSTCAEQSLDFEEKNALRYCGGYIIRSLRKKMSKSINSSLLEEHLLCLDELVEG